MGIHGISYFNLQLKKMYFAIAFALLFVTLTVSKIPDGY